MPSWGPVCRFAAWNEFVTAIAIFSRWHVFDSTAGAGHGDVSRIADALSRGFPVHFLSKLSAEGRKFCPPPPHHSPNCFNIASITSCSPTLFSSSAVSRRRFSRSLATRNLPTFWYNLDRLRSVLVSVGACCSALLRILRARRLSFKPPSQRMEAWIESKTISSMVPLASSPFSVTSRRSTALSVFPAPARRTDFRKGSDALLKLLSSP
jgi:hypothetical protein